MTMKLLAGLTLGLAVAAAAPAWAGSVAGFGLDQPDPFQSDTTFAPATVASAPSLPGAFETMAFQNAGLTLTSFSEVNLGIQAMGPPLPVNTPRVAEPLSIAVFASGVLAMALLRRQRR